MLEVVAFLAYVYVIPLKDFVAFHWMDVTIYNCISAAVSKWVDEQLPEAGSFFTERSRT